MNDRAIDAHSINCPYCDRPLLVHLNVGRIISKTWRKPDGLDYLLAKTAATDRMHRLGAKRK